MQSLERFSGDCLAGLNPYAYCEIIPARRHAEFFGALLKRIRVAVENAVFRQHTRLLYRRSNTDQNNAHE